jgi:hypothetical protein
MSGCVLGDVAQLLPILDDGDFWEEDADVDPCEELWGLLHAAGARLRMPPVDARYVARLSRWLLEIA